MTKNAIIWCAVSSQAQTAEDKISLPEQERAARDWCEANGYTVIDVLKVEGYSRRESDIITALDDFAAQGVTAYHDLREHWTAQDFAVLVAYTHSRFGRSSTLHSYVIENTIRAGARIYLLQGGWIDQDDYRFSIALGGVTATTDVDRLVKARDLAMTARAKRGLPTSSSTILSHTVIRDEYGKALRLEVDDNLRRMWDDVAALLEEGISWKQLEAELYQRHGHVAADGRPYRRLALYRLLYHPTFWGNSARHFRDNKSKNGQRTSMWVFDPDAPAPEGVDVYYDTHPAVYTGDQAERVKAELRRRATSVKGKNRPHRSRRFSGLFICRECHYKLVYKGNKGYPTYACQSRYWKSEKRTGCEQRKELPEWKIHAWLDARLREMIAAGSPELFAVDNTPVDSVMGRIAALKAEIEAVEEQIRRLIRKQAGADDTLTPLYDEELAALGDRLKILKTDRATMQRQRPSRDLIGQQQRSFAFLVETSVDAFWQLPDVQINQHLHRLLANRRLVVEHGEIVGVGEGG